MTETSQIDITGLLFQHGLLFYPHLCISSSSAVEQKGEGDQ